MKTVEVVGYKREDLGTKFSKWLRAEGNVPCVLYGADDHVHFHTPMYLFKDLIYKPDAAFVNLNIEGKEYKAVMKDAQFHPVSEMILHVDFLLLNDKNPIKMQIPVKTTGKAEGVVKGGEMFVKTKKLTVKALPKDMPSEILIDVTNIELGKKLKVKDIKTQGYEILNNSNVPVIEVNIPRTLRSSTEEAPKAAAATPASAAAPAAAKPAAGGDKKK